MLQPIPPALLTLYADLAQQARYAQRGGTVYRRAIGGASYLYAKVSVGAGRRDIFPGREDEGETQEKAEAIRRAASAAKDRRATIRTLKSRGLRGPEPWLGRVLDAVADAGLFARGVVLVGAAAYQLMEPLVGRHLPDASLITGDVDLVTVDLALKAETGESMEAILQRADPTLSAILELDLRHFSSRFKGSEALVEILTPILQRTDSLPLPLSEMSAAATPLQYRRWLTEDPVAATALWGPGVPVSVPAPARYAVHKLILAQKRLRTSREKRFKYLSQAAALIEALRQADPFAIEDALEDARRQGTDGWEKPISRSLAELGLSGL